MNQYFKRLFTYNDWANQITLDTLEREAINDEYIIRMLSHIINAQFVWIGRITDTAIEYKVWDVHPITQMRALLETNKKLCLDYIEKAKSEEFSRIISYTNSAGYFESIISDCLIHMVNHATHHRG